MKGANPTSRAYTVKLAKESFKFSCSHFTIFSKTSAERLHGHNYYLSVSVKVTGLSDDLGMAFDFNELKPIVVEICSKLDERVLIPKASPFLEIKEHGQNIEIFFSQKMYSIPASDVQILEVSNITSEELCRFVADQIALKWRHPAAESILVEVQETRGQSVELELNL